MRINLPVHNAGEQINAAVLRWLGVSAHPHRFGGTEFRLGTREIGHIHGDWLVDIPFPKRVRDELVANGRAQPHHILPETGWVSCYLLEPEDVTRAIALLHDSYMIAINQKKRTSTTPVDTPIESESGPI